MNRVSSLNKYLHKEEKGKVVLEKASTEDEAHFGFSEVLSSLENDRELVQELIRVLMMDIPAKINQLNEAYNQGGTFGERSKQNLAEMEYFKIIDSFLAN